MEVSERRESIDAFRGFTILGMILVNSPGSWDHVYSPLLHADWNGCTAADLVFPFFLFIVGISIVFAYSKKIQKGTSRIQLVRKAFVRTLILFGIGLALNILMSGFREVRIPGVLQRIAIVYFIGSILFLYAPRWIIILLSLVILLGYWMLLIWVPPPSQAHAVLEPGLNIANWVDFKIIPCKMYRGTWDPEGLLSTLPAIVTCTIGMMAGWLMLRTKEFAKSAKLLLLSGLILVIIGLTWSLAFPLNKNLWTSSYVLFTSGLGFLFLGLFEILTNAGNFKQWLVLFLAPGYNALSIYILHILLIYPFVILNISSGNSIQSLFMSFFTSVGLSLNFTSLLWAIVYIFLCFIPALILYRKKILIKV